MQEYNDYQVLYGDLHNHCGISYGHGSIVDAINNAKEQLDFCSITGHALWPDMPKANPSNQYLIDFHEAGFKKLEKDFPKVRNFLKDNSSPEKLITFLSYEMHSCSDGDYTVVYYSYDGDILKVKSLGELHDKIKKLHRQGKKVLIFPHHIGYRKGRRGINWDSFNGELSPVVEILSMHGCSENDESSRPFLHTMGPCDYKSTMQHGLEKGHFFGVIASTDHHSAHPGSYGHGRTAVWAKNKSREAIWEALENRRTYAVTGDRIELEFAVNSAMMGQIIVAAGKRNIHAHIKGGGAIDYVDIIKNGNLFKRFSQYDMERKDYENKKIKTKLMLELGWGKKDIRFDWEAVFGISEGKIISIEPRFRGLEVVSPLDKKDSMPNEYYFSHSEQIDSRNVQFKTSSFGNTTNSTKAMQGMCLEVEMPLHAKILAEINKRNIEIPFRRLIEGAYADNIGEIETPAFCFHRAPMEWEYTWNLSCEDFASDESTHDVYYMRVRQQNDQWAWSSPILVEK